MQVRMLPAFRIGVMLGALLVTCGVLARPAAAATVSVSPADTTVTNSSSFTIRLEVDAVSNLKAYQLIYTYPPARLRFDGAVEGELLTAGGAGTMFVRTDVAPHDSIWVDCARLDGSASGPGVLAYLQFTALATGTAPVDCAHVDFRDSANVFLFPACTSGIVRVTGPVGSLRRTWGALKQVYR